MFTYTSKPDDTREYSYVNFDNGALVQEEAVAFGIKKQRKNPMMVQKVNLH